MYHLSSRIFIELRLYVGFVFEVTSNFKHKKAHFIMSGLFRIWLFHLGSNQGPAD